MQESKLSNFYHEIGIRIKNAREINDITQEVLADQLNLSRASIINIEKGRHRPSLHLLLEIADVLQIDYTTLVPTPPSHFGKQIQFDITKAVSDHKISKGTEDQIKQIISSI